MKLIASGVIFSAAIVRSPSFSRSSSSTTTTIFPARKSSIASETDAKIASVWEATLIHGFSTLRCYCNTVLLIPGFRRTNRFVNRVDVLHALILEPIFQGLHSGFRVNGDGFLPCRTSAQNTRIVGSRFRCHFQRLDELRIAHTGAQVDEGFLCDLGSPTVVI